MHLETLGKQAAGLSESGELSLTDAVVRTIGREKLNSEQVRRVVEHANIEAYNRKFASLSGVMRAVHIDGGPADPMAVLQSLNDGARPKEVTIDALEYVMPPETPKTASFAGGDFFDRTAGGVRHDVHGLHQRLSAAHDELTQGAEAARGVMNDAMSELADHVKRASLQGATPDEIWRAWSVQHGELAKLAFARTKHLMGPDVKVAGRSLSPATGVVRAFADFVKAAQSYEAHVVARNNVEAEICKISNWMKERAA